MQNANVLQRPARTQNITGPNILQFFHLIEVIHFGADAFHISLPWRAHSLDNDVDWEDSFSLPQ